MSVLYRLSSLGFAHVLNARLNYVKNKFFAAIFALRIYRFAQVPNARFGHVQMNLAATLSLRICRLSSKILYGTPLECI